MCFARVSLAVVPSAMSNVAGAAVSDGKESVPPAACETNLKVATSAPTSETDLPNARISINSKDSVVPVCESELMRYLASEADLKDAMIPPTAGATNREKREPTAKWADMEDEPVTPAQIDEEFPPFAADGQTEARRPRTRLRLHLNKRFANVPGSDEHFASMACAHEDVRSNTWSALDAVLHAAQPPPPPPSLCWTMIPMKMPSASSPTTALPGVPKAAGR